MMVEAKKIFFLGFVCLPAMVLFCGCQNKQNLINTSHMPGEKLQNLINTIPSDNQHKKDVGLVRTKSGVYIYKDNATINTTGYKFHIKDKTDLGPSDVRFDAEHFKTRY